VLNAHERLFLIDCAEGTQVQLRKFRCKLSRIDHIFISHLHGDHTLGLVGLISTFNLLGRKNELHIFAHEPLEPILNINLNFFVKDLNFPIVFHPIKVRQKGLLYSDKTINVEVFPLKHRVPSSGFLFREQPKEPNIRKELIERYKISMADIILIKGGADLLLSNGKLFLTLNLLSMQASLFHTPTAPTLCISIHWPTEFRGWIYSTMKLHLRVIWKN
jgi:ribonuclease Z